MPTFDIILQHMDTPEDKHSALLFSRAYSYEESDVWSHPVNRGRLAEALLLTDTVLVHTNGFSEIQALVEELGSQYLLELIRAGRMRFLLCPYFFGRIRTPLIPWDICFMVNMAFEGVVEGRASLSEAIQGRLSKIPYEIPDLGPDLMEAIEDSTLVVPSDIPRTAKHQLLCEFLDDRMAAEYERLLEKYLRKPYPVREVFNIVDAGGTYDVIPKGDMRDPTTREQVERIGDGFALLLEARQQSVLYAWAGTDIVLTSPLFSEILSVESGNQDVKAILAADSEVGLNLATAVLKLPDVAFLVNRDLLSLKRVVHFSTSKNGSRVRNVLRAVVDGKGGSGLVQRYAAAFFDDLLPSWRLQKLASSGLLESVAFVTGQAIGVLCPPAGIVVAVAEKATRRAIGGRWRILPVIKRHLVGKVLTRDVERERDRRVCYPNLDRLREQGFHATKVLWLDGEDQRLGEVLLDAEQGRKRIHVVVRRDEYGEDYLRRAELMLSEHGS